MRTVVVVVVAADSEAEMQDVVSALENTSGVVAAVVAGPEPTPEDLRDAHEDAVILADGPDAED